MRVLIDECVDPRVKLLLSDHTTVTVHEMGWDTLQDGPLLAIAQEEFDVLVTIDGSPAKPFEIPDRSGCGPPKNQLGFYRTIHEQLLGAIGKAQPGNVIHIKA